MLLILPAAFLGVKQTAVEFNNKIDVGESS